MGVKGGGPDVRIVLGLVNEWRVLPNEGSEE